MSKRLTPFQLRALMALDNRGPMTPTQFAEAMWPDSPGWRRVVKSGNNSVVRGRGMPKTGGSHLGKLRAAGLVDTLRTAKEQRVERYVLTSEGIIALRKAVKAL